MRGLTKFCTLALQLLLISLTSLSSFSQAKHHKHRPSAFVVGSVYCDTRSSPDSPRTAHFISGATVSVECNVDGAFKAAAKTNKHGKYKVPLPLSVATHSETDVIKGCRVSLLRSSDPHCTVASMKTSSLIRHLKSPKQGSSTRLYSAGSVAFKPLKYQRPGVARSKDDGIKSQKSLLDPITSGPMLGLGPILEPVLPQLPPLLGMPNPLQPPSTPSFGFPGGTPGFSGLNPTPPSFGFPGGAPGFSGLNPTPPSFGFTGGAPGFPGLNPTPPAFPIPFPPRVAKSARKGSP